MQFSLACLKTHYFFVSRCHSGCTLAIDGIRALYLFCSMVIHLFGSHAELLMQFGKYCVLVVQKHLPRHLLRL
jgi:hypothetical protein